jgi:succinate dehydrogenase / fumarate reductase cytochrome b subunit
MKKKVRPLSPHLLVYKPQLTSVFSIFHRISAGVLLFVFIVSISIFYCHNFYLSFFTFYFVFYYFFPFFSFVFYLLFYFIFFIFFFHMINGLRHLSWDFGLGLEIKNVYITGTFVFCISLVIVFFIILI